MDKGTIRFVYFVSPVQVRSETTTKPMHALSDDRYEMELKGNWLWVNKDGYVTTIPTHNISSVVYNKVEVETNELPAD